MGKQPKKRLSNKSFTGVLLEPIDRPNELVIRAMAKNDPQKFLTLMMAASDRVNEQEADRLVALAAHYEVRSNLPIQDQLLRTLFCLARQFVPGFQFSDQRPRRGRRPGSARLAGPDLLREIDNLVNKGHTVANACALLVKRPGRWKGEKKGSVETAYYEDLKKLAKVGEGFRSHPLYSHLLTVLHNLEQDHGETETGD